MKKSSTVLFNNQLTKLWQQILRKDNAPKLHYNLQPIPVHNKMMPVSKTRNVMPFLSVLIVVLVVSIGLSSCFTSGYGCKGKSRIITRVR